MGYMFSRQLSIVGIFLLLLLSVSLVTYRTLLSQTQQKIYGSDTAAGDYFGSSVSIDGDTLLVGAFYDDEPQTDTGAGFIFERTGATWTQSAKLVSGDPAMHDGMGFDVSLSGDVAVLGAPWDDLAIPNSETKYNTGSAAIFENNGSDWIHKQKIVASDAQALDNLGWGVSIEGTRLAVGAPKADVSNLADAGAVYIFEDIGGTWTEQAKITAPSPDESEEFGRGVKLLGNIIFIGAWRSDAAVGDAGAVYVFQESSGIWSHQQTITASDAVTGDGFGEYVAADNDLLLIGSWLSDDKGAASGSAYVFRLVNNTWTEEAKLIAPDGAAGDRMGFRLDISNGIAAVGSRDDDHSGFFDAGSTYLFKQINGSWQQLVKLVANDAQSNDNMGIGVAVSVDTVASSAERTDQSGTDSGSVYLDDIPSAPPTPTPVPLVAATQVAPIDEHTTGILTYEWLEVTNATSYTLVVYDVGANAIVFSDTYDSTVCASNNCLVEPQNLNLTSGDYTWLVRPVNDSGNGPWSTYNSGTCAGLVQEAESGDLNDFFVTVSDSSASGGQYIHVPEGTGNEWTGPVAGKQADYCFNVSQAGIYRINTMVKGLDAESDAFFVQVDGSPTDGYLWDVPQNSSFVQDYVADRGVADPVEVSLSAGLHTVSVFLREDGARLDKIELELISSNVATARDFLRMPAPNVNVSGNIYLDNGRTTLIPIRVRLSDMFSYGLDYLDVTHADASGYYEFLSVPPGHYNVQISVPEQFELVGPGSINIEVDAYTHLQLPFDIIARDDGSQTESPSVEDASDTYLPLIR